MQRAKAFFYVSLGILALAISFHLGARTSESQMGGDIATTLDFLYTGDPGVGTQQMGILMTNGDVYSWDGVLTPKSWT